MFYSYMYSILNTVFDLTNIFSIRNKKRRYFIFYVQSATETATSAADAKIQNHIS